MPEEFVPRDWQDRFARAYQTNLKRNFLLEACTSAGKTGGTLNIFDSFRSAVGWRFLVVVVPAEHLRRQYAVDAQKLFGLQLYYSGTVKSLGRLPTPEELLQQGYQGLVVSYQWLASSGNAKKLASQLQNTLDGKVLAILDEVHHVSSELPFGRACEIAFPDGTVSHRLMTSGTPFRSDNNKILGNWLTYVPAGENVYECVPDFRYTLADALRDEIIPVFSFATMGGKFTYRRGRAVYEGVTFTEATNEQELTDALHTAINVNGGWVQEAITWAHQRMQRDRANGLPECATYVRVPTIQAARQMGERIRRLTGEDALVVVSKDDDPTSNFTNRQDPTVLIERFTTQTGSRATSWIIGVGMLGEGVSIPRLKYRIHATNNRALLSFMQDLGRLLRLFPKDEPEAVETLIPAHPTLIDLALNVLNEVAHVVREQEEEEESSDEQDRENGNRDSEPISSTFEPIASTGELEGHIVESEEIPIEYAIVAEWAIENNEIWRHWGRGKTPAHLSQMLMRDKALFEFLYQQYRDAQNNNPVEPIPSSANVPSGFPLEYATSLPDEKLKFARKEANKKAFRLANILSPNASPEELKKKVQEIYSRAKRKHGIPLKGFVNYEGWERIYQWLGERIVDANRVKGEKNL
jgi:superfamily II DNA or RNA helicase